MEHLTALDAAFLEVEDSDPHVSLAVGGVSIMEGPAPSYDEFVSAFAERVPTIPRCRQVLRTHPLDLGPPEWVDDPHFDISRHLHRLALPHPGGDAELFEMIATVMERRLDRERPLWECWIIEGLSDNRWAVLTKIHHCIADGIATTQMLAKFSDDDGGDTFATDIRAAKEPVRPWAGSAEGELEPVELGERDRAKCVRRGGRSRTRGGGCGRTDGQSAQPGAGIVADTDRSRRCDATVRPGFGWPTCRRFARHSA